VELLKVKKEGLVMENNSFSVKEAAKVLKMSEEIVRRKLREGKFPNAFKASDKGGWKIPKCDVANFEELHGEKGNKSVKKVIEEDNSELIKSIFKLFTSWLPDEDLFEKLKSEGPLRTTELLLMAERSEKPVSNLKGFIFKSIENGWSLKTKPKQREKKPDYKSKIANKAADKLAEYDKHWTEEKLNQKKSSTTDAFFYNWLDDK
jgi:hypothetical protein